jgi:hypothetical protein
MDYLSPLKEGRHRPTLHAHRLFHQALKAGIWSTKTQIADHVYWGTATVAMDAGDQPHFFWQELSQDRVLLKHATAKRILQPPSPQGHTR